jgi:hypothetical protein
MQLSGAPQGAPFVDWTHAFRSTLDDPPDSQPRPARVAVPTRGSQTPGNSSIRRRTIARQRTKLSSRSNPLKLGRAGDAQPRKHQLVFVIRQADRIGAFGIADRQGRGITLRGIGYVERCQAASAGSRCRNPSTRHRNGVNGYIVSIRVRARSPLMLPLL